MKIIEMFLSLLFMLGILIISAMLTYIGFMMHWTVGVLVVGIEISFASFVLVGVSRQISNKK